MGWLNYSMRYSKFLKNGRESSYAEIRLWEWHSSPQNLRIQAIIKFSVQNYEDQNSLNIEILTKLLRYYEIVSHCRFKRYKLLQAVIEVKLKGSTGHTEENFQDIIGLNIGFFHCEWLNLLSNNYSTYILLIESIIQFYCNKKKLRTFAKVSNKKFVKSIYKFY